jgi:hypothetical protein
MQVPATGASSYASPAAQATPSMSPASTKPDTARQDFLAFSKMTPAEKMRAMILGSMGLTEDQLKAMDPKERQKIEDKIKALIREQVERLVEKGTGLAVDLKV